MTLHVRAITIGTVSSHGDVGELVVALSHLQDAVQQEVEGTAGIWWVSVFFIGEILNAVLVRKKIDEFAE